MFAKIIKSPLYQISGRKSARDRLIGKFVVADKVPGKEALYVVRFNNKKFYFSREELEKVEDQE